MSAQDLINWGELSRLLSGSRMNVRKNRIPEKYKEQVTSLINCPKPQEPQRPMVGGSTVFQRQF